MKETFVTEINLITGQHVNLNYPEDKLTHREIVHCRVVGKYIELKVSDEIVETIKKIVGDRIVERHQVVAGEKWIHVNPEHIVSYITEEKEVVEEGEK